MKESYATGSGTISFDSLTDERSIRIHGNTKRWRFRFAGVNKVKPGWSVLDLRQYFVWPGKTNVFG